ncbi:methyltransferase domain-containing protein [Pleionea sediminis]|uniref:methyltransferase domain-containing protein n=1 Tax=Pleionea sediminis TaxID=2569479 RepID=UPI001185FA6C|nr:methyltransferase domain-containing protein [Pleionea sediminis]
MAGKSLDLWASFWAEGYLTTYPAEFAKNYDKGIKSFWFSIFENAPDNARILDVCSGNGAIALLAAEFSSEFNKNFKITAVDLAKVDPKVVIQRYPEFESLVSKIEFLSGTDIQALSIEEHSFDLILSQFGLEYLNDIGLLNNLAKGLASKGELILVAHPDTAMARQSLNQEFEQYKLLDSLNAISRLKKFVRNDASQREMQVFCRELYQELSKSLMSRVSPILKQLLEVCQFVLSVNQERFKDGKPKIFKLFKDIWLNRVLLEQQRKVYQRFDENSQWFQELTEVGFELEEQGEVKRSLNQLFGQYYRLKPA